MDHREEDEISYWRGKFEEYKKSGDKWFDVLLNDQSPLDVVIEREIKNSAANKNDRVKVLDVGCGPLSSLGKNGTNFRIDITGIDPMAESYKELLGSYGISPQFNMMRGVGEEIDQMFEPESFDFVHSRNALDHCFDVPKVLRNLIFAAKEDCKIYFRVFRNEAEGADYSGFHSWNFDTFADRVCVWTPAEIHFLDRIIDGFPYRVASGNEHGGETLTDREIAVVIHKTTRNLERYNEFKPGLFSLFSKKENWLVLHATQQVDDRYNFFVHPYFEQTMLKPFSFRWYPGMDWRFIPLPNTDLTHVVIGQFEPQYSSDGSVENYNNLWTSHIMPNYEY